MRLSLTGLVISYSHTHSRTTSSRVAKAAALNHQWDLHLLIATSQEQSISGDKVELSVRVFFSTPVLHRTVPSPTDSHTASHALGVFVEGIGIPRVVPFVISRQGIAGVDEGFAGQFVADVE